MRRWSRIAFFAAMVFAYGCAIAPGNPAISSNDKINHMLAFGALSILARLGWPRVAAWKPALYLTAFGGFIELSQALPIIHRDAEWADLLADAIATLLGLAAAIVLERIYLWRTGWDSNPR